MALVAYTRTLIVTRVRRRLQEATAGLFTDADIQDWIDTALLDISTQTHCLRGSASAATTAAGQEFTITANALGAWAITRMDYNGRKLEMLPFDQIDREIANANTKSLSSQGEPRYWIPYGRTFLLWPVPAASGSTVTYWYAQASDTLSANGMSIADLGFGLSYGIAVEDFCVARGFELAGQTEKAGALWQVYERDLQRAAMKVMADNAPADTRGSG